ncbi:2019_t:CDS:2 [Paraglomus occultum]|uniref:2019_t:CDS:1 n=1 Tax=Paraglomus occultum TaxID=144539 RepID=A0A9N9D509_9GLOM|nr:2019_t:CDS:2 [Paraglomus occultum]
MRCRLLLIAQREKDACSNSIFIWIFQKLVELTMDQSRGNNSDDLKALYSCPAEELEGTDITALYLNTKQFLHAYSSGTVQACRHDLVEGTVIPESAFRHTAILLKSAYSNDVSNTKIFTSPRGPSGITTMHRDGTEFSVDIQTRVVEYADEPLRALWITYDRSLADSKKDDETKTEEAMQTEETLDDEQSNSDDEETFSMSKFLAELVEDLQRRCLGECAYGIVKLAYNTKDPEKKLVVLEFVFKSRILVDSWIPHVETTYWLRGQIGGSVIWLTPVGYSHSQNELSTTMEGVLESASFTKTLTTSLYLLLNLESAGGHRYEIFVTTYETDLSDGPGMLYFLSVVQLLSEMQAVESQ